MGITEILHEVRTRIDRVPPEGVAERVAGGAVVVDLRCGEERRRTGMIPGSIAIARSVLEWRADPESPWHDDRLDPATETLLICEEGYSSSLAADSLRRLGYRAVGDVEGGVERWREHGLPLVPPGD